MRSYFADTSLFVAFLNPRDEYHELAVEFIGDESNFLVTTTVGSRRPNHSARTCLPQDHR
jgi:predicted nucleic acid-binding protein